MDGIPPNPQRRNQRSYAAILDATINQLTSVGYHRMTIERVAQEAGVGKATVYRWWPTKARLAVEALSVHSDIESVTATGDLRTDVRALVRRSVEIMTTTPLGHALPYLAADFHEDPDARAELLRWFGPTRAGHLALMYQAGGRGELPHDLDANLLLDLVAGTVLYRALIAGRIDDEFVEQLTTLIVDRQLPRVMAETNRFASARPAAATALTAVPPLPAPPVPAPAPAPAVPGPAVPAPPVSVPGARRWGANTAL